MTTFPSDMQFTKPNPRYAEVECAFPDAPLVAVHWMDASYDSAEKIVGELATNYKAGIVDVLVGFYLGERDDCIVVSNSAYVGKRSGEDSHRHIWNIPVDMIIRIEELKPKPRLEIVPRFQVSQGGA